MSDVLHFPNTYRERNGFWGISTLKFALDTLSLIKTESSWHSKRQQRAVASRVSHRRNNHAGTRHTGLRMLNPEGR